MLRTGPRAGAPICDGLRKNSPRSSLYHDENCLDMIWEENGPQFERVYRKHINSTS